MGKSLVIVESPAKAKTINKYLGKDYVVKSSVGHVRDLPTSGSASTEPKTCHSRHQAQRIREGGQGSQRPVLRMGINPTAGWQANYQILPGKEKVVSELQSLAAKADTIYLATDLDREGKRSPGTCARSSVATTAATSAWCSTRSPRAPSRRRSPSRPS